MSKGLNLWNATRDSTGSRDPWNRFPGIDFGKHGTTFPLIPVLCGTSFRNMTYQIVVGCSREQGQNRRERLVRAYHTLTGSDITNRLGVLKD